MEHPDKAQNDNQKRFLDSLPDNLREEHARLFRYGNAAYVYHKEANKFEPTEVDYKEWLSGLPESIQADMERLGFEKCKSILSFTRYVNEKNDIGMDQWMKEHLNEDDFNEYLKANF